MLSLHWLSRLLSSYRGLPKGRLPRERTKERRLKLLRLEQRRVLNADFSFTPQALTLSHVDGDLTVREVSSGLTSHIEFDLHGSIWHDADSTGTFAIDNSTPGHSILSVEKSALENLTAGVSLSAASSAFDLNFDVQSSSLDLCHMYGTLVADGFGTVSQTASTDYDVNVADVSLSADHISLSNFRGDDITLIASEIDLTGGADTFSGSTLSILSATSHVELGGSSDSSNSLDFTDGDISALDASFHAIHFAATSSSDSTSITVDASGADFSDALHSASAHTTDDPGQLHLVADSIHIDGELTIPGGWIDITATQDVTISEFGSLVSHGGQVHVDAGESGTLLDSGDIDVSNSEPGGVGGSVHLLGRQVGLFGDAEVDASGHSGGGEVLIGGDLYGDNPAIPHAAQTFIGHDVEVHADALHSGDGGTIVVWSDEVTQVYGSLTARGGALLGDGGLIETSSHQQLIVTRGGDASAANGHAGTWLLDPFNITIVAALSQPQREFAQLPNFNPTVGDDFLTTPAIETSEVEAGAIQDQLNAGTNVVISTENLNFDPNDRAGDQDGDVVQMEPIHVTFDIGPPGMPQIVPNSVTLTIIAARHIIIDGGITAENGILNVVLMANTGADDLDQFDGTNIGNVYVNADINTNGGSFSSTGVDFDSAGVSPVTPDNPMPMIATITATGGVSIIHSGTVDLGPISTGSEFGGTTTISGANVRGDIKVGEGDVFIDGGNPDLIVTANITATETIFLLADRDVIVESTVTAGSSNPTADLFITADADSAPDPTPDLDPNNDHGGFWLRETGNPADAKLIAGGNISIVGADLVASTALDDPIAGTTDSLRIDADGSNRQIEAGNDLTLVANFEQVSSNGDVRIDGILHATDGSLTVFATGTTYLGAGALAGEDILFKDAVELTEDVTLTAGNDLTFSSSVDADVVTGTGSELIVTTQDPGGNILFTGAIGGANPLDSLMVNGTGFVDFLNTVAVERDITVKNTSAVDFITFQGAVTTTGDVTIDNAGLLVTSPLATFTIGVGGSFQQIGSGTTELGANITTADGDVSFAQAVLLTESVTIDSSGGNQDITFEGPINSEVVPLGIGNVPVSQVGGDVLDVKAEHNSLTLTAGSGEITFHGNIGDDWIDVGAGADGDQTLGDLTIQLAKQVTFDGVTSVRTNVSMDFGSTGPITNGITINGTAPIAFQSGQDIRINGLVTSKVDLSLQAAGDVTLTDAGSIKFNDILTDHINVTIVADSNGNSHEIGEVSDDFIMSPATQILAGAGIIDVSGANVVLGKLMTTSELSTDAEHPAIQVTATFGAITDINGDDLNLVANKRTDSEAPGAGVVLKAVTGIGSDDPLETNIASLSAYNHDLSEQQVVTLEHATSGNFTLDWTPPGGTAGTTDPILFNATADDVKAAFLTTFSTPTNPLTNADLNVSGAAGGPFIFTFLGALRATNVEPIVAHPVDLHTIGFSAPTVTADTIKDFTPAEHNIRIQDVGNTPGNGANNGQRVDLIFVHNEANQLEPQFATAVQEFTSTIGGIPTEITFSAATPGPSSNDIVINFTVDLKPHVGATANVPIIKVTGHTIDIDLHGNEDTNGNNKLDLGEDTNGNMILDKGTTANALRDAINSNHAANQLIRALITGTDADADPRTPGTNDISGIASGTSLSLTGAGAEDGVIDINIQNENLRVVNDNSRSLLLDMRDGTDHPFNPVDVAIPAIQAENTIRLTANTIEVFDDILAIQPLTETTTALDDSMTPTIITVVDPRVFPNDGSQFFIQIDQEILLVTAIDGNDLTVERGQNGTTAAAHAPSVTIANIGVDNGIRQYIEINARANFVLGADQTISTDDHYINSLNLREDVNGNGIIDVAETFTDANGNNHYDPGEAFIDMNGNGQHDAIEPFYDANLNLMYDGPEAFNDANGNGRFDESHKVFNPDGSLQYAGEDVNRDNTLQFNHGEDANRNGTLDPGEDLNGDGILQLRGDKPSLAATDNFFSAIQHDSIHITADSDLKDLTGGTEGRVLLGENSTISTDNGIEQQISQRPFRDITRPQDFAYTVNSGFFSGDIAISNLQSRFLNSPELLPDGTFLPANATVYLGTLTFTIGAPGEKNLILDIDWGDHDRTSLSPIPPTTVNVVVPKFVNGIYVFDSAVDQHATRYLIPEGGASYSIPHEFSDFALNLKDATGMHAIQEPGRVKTSDPFQIRFAVSQHQSIVIDGQSVLDPSTDPKDVTTAPADVPQNAPYDRGRINKPYHADDPPLNPRGADPLFQLTSTNVFDQQDLFLPRFDNGLATITNPTPPSVRIPKEEQLIAPPEAPKPAVPSTGIVTPPLLNTESTRSSASSSSVTTDEFFELHLLNEDGSIGIERLRDGEGLLERDRFEEFVRDRGDGEYEIWFITRENGTGARIERPVIQFRLEGGRIAAPASDDQKLFKPFRLIPVPVPPPVNAAPAGNGDGSEADTENNLDVPDQEPNSDELSFLEFRGSQSEFAVWPTQSPLESSMQITDHSTHEFAAAFAAGVLVFPSLPRRKHRSAAKGSTAYSLSARLARKRSVLADD